jgi:hypothetical protein
LMIMYNRTDQPCPGLTMEVKYIVQVYCVVWFLIKRKSRFIHGPSHLFTQITLLKSQTMEVQNVVGLIVQRNAYLAHPSTLLCAREEHPL